MQGTNTLATAVGVRGVWDQHDYPHLNSLPATASTPRSVGRPRPAVKARMPSLQAWPRPRKSRPRPCGSTLPARPARRRSSNSDGPSAVRLADLNVTFPLLT